MQPVDVSSSTDSSIDATRPVAWSEKSNLTRSQFLMWMGQRLNPDAPLYNMVQTFTIHAELDCEAFTSAFQSLVDASDALRTTIDVVDGAPQQRVSLSMPARLEFVDLGGTPAPERAYAEWLAERKGRLLPLRECLFDSALVKVGEQHYVWYLCQHHLITDGQSFALSFEYMAARYALAVEGRLNDAPDLPVYADYIGQERAFRSSDDWHSTASYWQSQVDEDFSMPVFYGRQATSGDSRTERLVLSLGAERSSALRAIARSDEFATLSLNMSLYNLWMTLLAVVVHRITGEDDLRIGTPFEARPKPEHKRTIGLFIEIGVLNARVQEGDTFASLFERLLEETFSGMRHIAAGISGADINRSYSVLLNYVTSKFEDFAGLPVRTDWIHAGYGDEAHVLRLQICDFDDSDEFAVLIDVNASVFDRVHRDWLINDFNAVIDAFLQDPQRSIGGFDLLTSARRQQIAEFNGSSREFDLRSVVHLLEDQVQSDPGALAAEQAGRRMTFAGLNERANQFAAYLAEFGVAKGDRVAICMPRSLEVLVAIWGVLKAGAAFVPFEPSFPARRKSELLRDLSAAAVVCLESTKIEPASDFGGTLIVMDQIELAHLPTTNPDNRPAGGDIAYLIYTSGSTGQPKATMLSHEGLANYVLWARETYLGSEHLDFALYSSLAFDLTLTTVFVAAIAGGSVRIYGEDSDAPGLEILSVFSDDAVDVVKLTPAHLELLRSQPIHCSRIRKLILGGEDLKTRLVNSVLGKFVQPPEIYNEYGPTEATIGCMVHRFDPMNDREQSVPIGIPAANTQIHLRDSYGQPVSCGVVGEIVIAGPGVALGYWRRDELTSAQFFVDRESGLRSYRSGDLARWGESGRLQFLGRRDDQVKLRGVRVELGEVEAALLEYPDVTATAAIVIDAANQEHAAIVHCVECGLPSNFPNAKFDGNGICADCREYQRLQGEVARYFRSPSDLRRVLDDVRKQGANPSYDCIVLTSGGKDSTYMLYQLVREYGVRPLVFTLDNGYLSDRAVSNVRLACQDLGTDLEVGSTPHMNAIFADSLRRHCNVCNGCFKTIYTLSMSLARRLGIQTIVTGLSRGQLFETRLSDTFRARLFDPDKIDNLVNDARKVYHKVDDAVYKLLETDLFNDESVFDDISFIDFYRYVDVGLGEVYRYLEQETIWERPRDTGRSTNCLINDVGIYVHNRERGYHNYALPYSWDVRLGHKTRESALDELDDEIDEGRVHKILHDIGYEPAGSPLDKESQKLVGYYVSEHELGYRTLKEHMSVLLPKDLVPSSFVHLEKLPLTRNGKIDRAALPEPGSMRPDLDTSYVAPNTAEERQLASIWSAVMDIDQIGINDNFFALGGDSVMSIQIAASATQSGLQLTPRHIFTHRTIAELARELSNIEVSREIAATATARKTPSAQYDVAAGCEEDIARVRNAYGAGFRANVEEIYPLAPLQAGMLYHALFAPDNALYVGQVSWSLDGPIDYEKLKLAWQQTIDRHSALRTQFFWEGLDSPQQVVCRNTMPDWDYRDWRDVSESQLIEKIERLQNDNIDKGFDLSQAPLMRFALVRASETRTHLIWTIHHILLDGWSAYPILAEWLRNYDGLVAGRKVQLAAARPYRDFVGWLRAQDDHKSSEFWQRNLAGFTEPSTLPIRKSTPVDSVRSAEYELTFSIADSDAIRGLAKRFQVTLNSVFQAAWSVLLSRYCDRSDVVFGATVSGRNGDLAHMDQMIGLFINTVPVRLTVDPESTVSSWLPQIQQALLDISEFDYAALPDIQRCSEIPADQSLFDSIVVFENYPVRVSHKSSTLKLGPLKFKAPSHYPLAVLVYPDERMKIVFVYNREQLAESDIARMSGHVRSILVAMAGKPDGRLKDLPILTDIERQQLLTTWNSVPSPGDDQLLHTLVSEMAQETPDAIALACGQVTLSYADLDRRSNQLANYLHSCGVARGDLVGLMATRHLQSVVGIIGILKAGAAYVPVDPDSSIERVRGIISDAGLALMVTTGDAVLPAEHGVRCVNIDTFEFENYSVEPTQQQSVADDLAYVIYTSGSTGKPKGVMISHRNIVHSTKARFSFYPGRVGSFLLLSSLAFDSSMVGVFWTLCQGGTLVLPGPGLHTDTTHLASLIETRKVTHLLALPSFYDALLDAAQPAQMDSLEIAIVAGEACYASLFERHARYCSQARLYNEYGPTEATVWSHAWQFPSAFKGMDVPIGTPIPNVTQFVVDGDLRAVPVGVPGELIIGGSGIAAGYLHQPELTSENFITLPADLGAVGDARFYRTGDLVKWRDDGNLMFLGRIDEQVKIRGFRVEPAEIEAAMLSIPGINGAAVGSAKLGSGGSRRVQSHRLLAWYASDHALADTELRELLSELVPDFMIPGKFVHLAELPYLPSGKVDRQTLAAEHPPADAVATAYRAPGTESQQKLATIWAELFGLDRVGIDDNFLDLGGDSISGLQLAARARQIGFVFGPRELMQHQTIDELTRAISESATPALLPESAPEKFALTGLSDEELDTLLDDIES